MGELKGQFPGYSGWVSGERGDLFTKGQEPDGWMWQRSITPDRTVRDEVWEKEIAMKKSGKGGKRKC